MSCIDYTQLHSRYEDDEIIKTMLSIFASDFDARLEKMAKLYESRNHAELYKAAQALKGASSTVAAETLRSYAEALEQAAATKAASLDTAWEQVAKEATRLSAELQNFLR